MALMEASRWAANAAVAVLLCGCFSPDDPPAGADTEDGSSSGGEGSSSPSGTTPGTGESSTGDATNPTEPTTGPTTDPTTGPTDPTTTGPSTMTDPTTDSDDTTGVEPACGDGAATADELCLDVTPNSLMVPPGPVDVALGDLSSNGLLDIALIALGTTPSDGNRFVVLEADGIGGFIEDQNLAIERSAGRVRLADLDQDDDLDVIVNGNALIQLRNQGSFFSASTVISNLFGNDFDLSDVFIADLNGDDIMDIAYTEGYGRSWVSGVISNGNWQPDTENSFPGPGEGASGMAAAALSAGDDIDALMFNQYNSGSIALVNDGSGTFSAGPSLSLCPGNVSGTRYGVIADFNDDGMGDVVVTCMDGDGAVNLGQAGGFADPVALPLAGAFKPSVADLDGDGDPDVLLTSRTLDRAVMYLNDGSGSFEISDIQFEAPGPVWGAVAGDVNNDGAMDVVVISNDGGGNPGRVDVYTAEP